MEIAIRSIMQMYTARTVMKTSHREPEGDAAPVLTFNIEVHHQGKSARYFRASRLRRHAFCFADIATHLMCPAITLVRIWQVADARQETNG